MPSLARRIAIVTALLALSAAAPAALAQPGLTSAQYRKFATAPQAKSPAGMQAWLSSNQPQMGLQAYIFYGSLTDDEGTEHAFATMVQRIDAVPGLPDISTVVAGILVGSGNGFAQGGIQGIPELTFPLTLTSNPWSVRAESVQLGQMPKFIDARVVVGQLGEPGAVYEITSDVMATPAGGGAPVPLQVYVRMRDTTGVGMWGYGPSGFFPQWLFPQQRSAILDTYGGSVNRYLRATRDPMTSQGSYYYSSPALEVQSFSLVQNGVVIAEGTEGALNADMITQSYDAQAEAVVESGIQWMEFTVPMPGLRQGMKIGKVSQPALGTMPYAMLVRAGGPTARNGALTPANRWNLGRIRIAPVASSTWTSPTSGLSYAMDWTVRLRDGKGRSGTMRLESVYDDQEVVIRNADGSINRAVYEGVFSFTGRVAGQPVSGFAWGEIQPAASLGG